MDTHDRARETSPRDHLVGRHEVRVARGHGGQPARPLVGGRAAFDVWGCSMSMAPRCRSSSVGRPRGPSGRAARRAVGWTNSSSPTARGRVLTPSPLTGRCWCPTSTHPLNGGGRSSAARSSTKESGGYSPCRSWSRRRAWAPSTCSAHVPARWRRMHSQGHCSRPSWQLRLPGSRPLLDVQRRIRTVPAGAYRTGPSRRDGPVACDGFLGAGAPGMYRGRGDLRDCRRQHLHHLADRADIQRTHRSLCRSVSALSS